MEDVSLIFSQSPKINIRVIDQQFDAFSIVSQNSVMQGSISFLTFMIDVVRVPHFLEDILYVVKYSLIACQHKRSHFLTIVFL